MHNFMWLQMLFWTPCIIIEYLQIWTVIDMSWLRYFYKLTLIVQNTKVIFSIFLFNQKTLVHTNWKTSPICFPKVFCLFYYFDNSWLNTKEDGMCHGANTPVYTNAVILYLAIFSSTSGTLYNLFMCCKKGDYLTYEDKMKSKTLFRVKDPIYHIKTSIHWRKWKSFLNSTCSVMNSRVDTDSYRSILWSTASFTHFPPKTK